MKNQDIRNKAAGAGVKLWQIADAIGIGDTTLCRRMRKELPEGEKIKSFAVIDELAKEVD